MKHGKFWLTVISHARPNAVPKIHKLLGLDATWYIGTDAREQWAYRATGAASVVPIGGLIAARNLALDHAFEQGLTCIELSDDISAFLRLDLNADGTKLVRPKITFREAVNTLWAELNKTDYRLGGIAPTDFISWDWHKNPIGHRHFVLGDFFMCKPTELRFEPRLKLKEDYDFTCQHVAAHGGVVRCNRLMIRVQHRTNDGGAVANRTGQEEQNAIAVLKEKWPDWIKANPRSPDEVLLKIGKAGENAT